MTFYEQSFNAILMQFKYGLVIIIFVLNGDSFLIIILLIVYYINCHYS